MTLKDKKSYRCLFQLGWSSGIYLTSFRAAEDGVQGLALARQALCSRAAALPLTSPPTLLCPAESQETVRRCTGDEDRALGTKEVPSQPGR